MTVPPPPSGPRVIIAGSRSISNAGVLDRAMALLPERPSLVLCGCAQGADRLGELWARANGVAIMACPADWTANGRRAGILRNTYMARNADVLVALWDGRSSGTKHMIEEAHRFNLDTHVWVCL